MAATYRQITDAIQSRLSTVKNIGRVYPFVRYLNSMEDYTDAFLDKSQIRKDGNGCLNGWTITRKSKADDQSANVTNTQVSTYSLLGIMALEDISGTELEFQQVIDDISAAFTPQDNFDDLVELVLPVQVQSIGHATVLNSILCHSAELTIQIQEYHTS
jgi:hypothetical protein